MNTRSFLLGHAFSVLPALALALSVSRVQAHDVDADDDEGNGPEVVVGITPTCPSGATACWPNISAAVRELKGVGGISTRFDPYNCTTQVRLKKGSNPLPDVRHWHEQFRSLVGESYVFRGVEVTIDGAVERKSGMLFFHTEGLPKPVVLAPLKHKLQWNYLKRRARGPEEDERTAYQQLAAKLKQSKGTMLKVRLTGPVPATDKGAALEVREFFLLEPDAYHAPGY